jgi:hypothetical protein
VYASHAAATDALRNLALNGAAELIELRGILYGFIERRSETVFPCREEYIVAAPAVVEDKARHGLPHFEVKWRSLQMRLWTVEQVRGGYQRPRGEFQLPDSVLPLG